MSDAPEGLKTWAIVELMGHHRIAGLVSEELVAGVPMLKVEVPAARVEGEGSVSDPFVRYYGAKALYALTPCEEHTAQEFVDYYTPTAVPVYLPSQSLLTAGDPQEVTF